MFSFLNLKKRYLIYFQSGKREEKKTNNLFPLGFWVFYLREESTTTTRKHGAEGENVEKTETGLGVP